LVCSYRTPPQRLPRLGIHCRYIRAVDGGKLAGGRVDVGYGLLLIGAPTADVFGIFNVRDALLANPTRIVRKFAKSDAGAREASADVADVSVAIVVRFGHAAPACAGAAKRSAEGMLSLAGL